MNLLRAGVNDHDMSLLAQTISAALALAAAAAFAAGVYAESHPVPDQP